MEVFRLLNVLELRLLRLLELRGLREAFRLRRFHLTGEPFLKLGLLDLSLKAVLEASGEAFRLFDIIEFGLLRSIIKLEILLAEVATKVAKLGSVRHIIDVIGERWEAEATASTTEARKVKLGSSKGNSFLGSLNFNRFFGGYLNLNCLNGFGHSRDINGSFEGSSSLLLGLLLSSHLGQLEWASNLTLLLRLISFRVASEQGIIVSLIDALAREAGIQDLASGARDPALGLGEAHAGLLVPDLAGVARLLLGVANLFALLGARVIFFLVLTMHSEAAVSVSEGCREGSC